MATTQTNTFFALDAAIYSITGDSPFTAEGLRSTRHLSGVAQERVRRLRAKRDAARLS